MASIFVTRKIPEIGITKLKNAGHDVVVSEKDGVLSKKELLTSLSLKPYDAVLCLLTDTIDAEVFEAVPAAKIFSNYAVGFNNIDTDAAREKNVVVTNTPGVLTDTVAEHTAALMLSITSRIAEGDRFIRAGRYDGWAPLLLLGTDLKGKTLGILGAGRIGTRVAEIAAHGLGMKIIYYDIKENEAIESAVGATFKKTVEEVLKEADVVTVHVPLLDSTRHLINKERLAMMKQSAYLINSSRGKVIDESALTEALKEGTIKGAALDVFEDEPKLSPGLAALENVVLTPHIASATEETRGKMAEIAAQAIIDVLEGREPEHRVA
ncbi:D-glycerate dehydrogenase [Candidatus Kaiserbacteria bacterium CG10_big_fil_rev_8_21_14_0_10_49_17]|uniref:D-glycerate dehydrogenase n=1 Tax=Candidatus Kaiserbacteria bacterium CG10_big_fil_rev_8_21_14_0_10_49_17 TaxID=1974609 RepID=A0A2M6WF34_9BACT|nr:MAG: D-glycerate dehydrogenase [Candidatus Kaiserbacteria bacterium CG10_big_fil_rev_8_21_14_0_10_49_17]